MHLSQKEKLFNNFLLQFWNLDQTLNILETKMTLIADVFHNLQTAKNMVT